VKKEENSFVKAEQELLRFLRPKLPKRTYREFEEILVIEFISVTGGVLAGALLAYFLDKIALIPGLLILLPGFLAMRGNISGSLAARIGEALHLGLLKHHNARYFLRKNNAAAFTLGVVVSVFLGLVAYASTWLFFRVNAPDIVLVALIAGVLSNLVLIPLTTHTAVWLFKKGHDPDNIMGPYITTVGDIVSVLALIIAVVLV
jgi:mgtE-like transporter